MILQALCEYYRRKVGDPEGGMAPQGFEWKEIPFVVVIDKNGKFVGLEDTREGEGKQRRARSILVPQGEKRASGIKANLLWDNVEYALGAKPPERRTMRERHEAFLARLRKELPDSKSNLHTKALLTFLESDPVRVIERSNSASDLWKEALTSNANVTFKLEGNEHASLCEAFRSHLAQRVSAEAGDGDEGTTAVCLATGRSSIVAKIHQSIKGVRDAQSSGASLVSFNSRAYSSFGKDQNFNAPVSKSATFEYTTALNVLLSKDSRNKLQVGDATTVFWSETKNDFEDQFASFFAMAPKDDPDRDVQAVQVLYKSLHTGAALSLSTTRFYVLGLAPNAARLAVRFWRQGTVAELSERIRQHFDDLDIVRAPHDTGRYALFWLLLELATERKIDNVPPALAGDIVRAVLDGSPYPRTLLLQALRRVRAEREISRIRASMLKAYLNRFNRVHPAGEKEITVALDLTNNNAGYRLGRLFAVLEKIQEDALGPGINATIRDRFYGAASSSPVTVFPQLLKLKNHHLAKLERPAFRIAHEKRLTEIFGGLGASMPSHLSMEEQARFAIGYYHQRQALFAKSSPADPISG